MRLLLLHHPRYRRRGVATLAVAYALYRLAPTALRLVRTTKKLLVAADDVTTAFAAAARELRQQFASSTGEPGETKALEGLLRALSSPDSLRILSTLVKAAIPASVNSPNSAGQSPMDILDGVLKAFDTPHGKRVATNVVSAAVHAVIESQPPPTTIRSSTVDSKQKKHGAKHQFSHPVDRLIDAALSDRGRALVLDALAMVVRTAVPAIVAVHSRPSSSSVHGTPSRSAPSPSLPTTPGRNVQPTNVPSSNNSTPQRQPVGGMERIVSRALRDRALMKDIVRVAAAEGVKTYLTTSVRLKFAPQSQLSPSPSSSIGHSRRLSSSSLPIRRTATRRVPNIPGPEPALWKTVGQAAAAAARRWLLRAARDNPQPSWIVF